MLNFSEINVKKLSGLKLERYVAAIFQSQGYFVERNLKWSEPRIEKPDHSIDVLEVDILAYNFYPYGENRILIECKGGGNFNDLFKFIGVKNFVKPDSAIFVSNNAANFREIEKVGVESGVIVLRTEDLLNKYSHTAPIEEIKSWYWFNELDDALLNGENLRNFLSIPNLDVAQIQALERIKSYYYKINSKIWTTNEPIEQSIIIEGLFENNRDFIREVGSIIGLTRSDSENMIAQNIICESASNVVLKARLNYIITALRCAIHYLVSTDTSYLNGISNPIFKNVVKKLTENIKIACRLPAFIQEWIYKYGGVLDLINDPSQDLNFIANQLHESVETVRLYITLINDIFSILVEYGNINWSFHDRNGIKEFRMVPDSIRGFGLNFRVLNTVPVENFILRNQWGKRYSDVCDTIK